MRPEAEIREALELLEWGAKLSPDMMTNPLVHGYMWLMWATNPTHTIAKTMAQKLATLKSLRKKDRALRN